MLDRNRECWTDIADKLSAYYNTPGRLAVFRPQFENAHRRPGLDPATFATELGILALVVIITGVSSVRSQTVCHGCVPGVMDLAATEDTANTSSCLRTELITIDAVIRIL